jgi:hypothetical protein
VDASGIPKAGAAFRQHFVEILLCTHVLKEGGQPKYTLGLLIANKR